MRPAPSRGAIASASVIGLGRIGGPLAACLASRGVKVIGVDIDGRKVDAVNAGAPPVSEPGLGSLIELARDSLHATRSAREAVLATDATLIAVPTPAEADGSLSLGYLWPACRAIGEAMRAKPEFHLVTVVSTVTPGTTGGALTAAIAEASGRHPDFEFAVCYAPEFVALGTAIHDFLAPDLVLIGEPDARSGELLEDLFRRICINDPPVARTSLVTAELAKLALNAFLATKITFANVLAGICEGLPDCDVDEVTSVVGRDSRVGGEYLSGGMPFGGPCLPRDTAALAALADRVGAPAQLANSVLEVNEALLDRLVELTRAELPPGGRVGICGLAFKPGTDVVEASPGATLARRLAEDGVPVVAFDPMVDEPACRALGEAIERAPSLHACLACADVVVLGRPRGSWAALDTYLFERPRTIIDPWRIVEDTGLETDHIAFGRGPRKASRGRPHVAKEPIRRRP